TGGLDLSSPGHPVFEECIASMKAVGVDHEKLDAKEIRARYPQFRIDPQTVGVFQKDAGILNPSQSLPLMVNMAKKHGATVIDNTAVTSFYFDENGVEVNCADQTYKSAKLIISTGPWAESVLKKVGVNVPLSITEERYVFFKPPRPDLF